MHAVLDGEADAGESAVLERHLAGDPAARAEFDELCSAVRRARQHPQGLSAGGLVASVMAQLPPVSTCWGKAASANLSRGHV